MKKISKWITDHLASLIVIATALLCAIFLMVGKPAEDGSITLDGSKAVIEQSTKDFIEKAKIEYGNQVKALMNLDGEDIEVDVPTVESIDGGKVTDDTYTGQGVYAPVDSPTSFKNFTINKCFDVDGAYGAQCWDLGALFWTNYAGRSLNTCGTGAAKGTIQDGCWQKNAGNEFTMIWDKTKIQAGDWIITSGGTWGHVGMALGNYNNGYVTLLGQNQGGGSCSGGGAATNIINMNLKDFAGAFRPNSYIKPEPTPTPTPEPTPTPTPTPTSTSYTVIRGDTLGGIVNKMGWCAGCKLFGDDGYCQVVADYNGIPNRGLIYPGQIIKKPE